MNSINELEEHNSKEEITRLADEARIHINQNKFLLEIIEIFKQQIKTVKNFITNYSLNSNQINNNNNLALKYKEQLSILNSKLKEEINKNNIKQKNILNNIKQDLPLNNQALSQFSIDNFILNNTINKYNSLIETLNINIKSSKKYEIFREPKREIEIETKESKKTIVDVNLENQQKMLSLSRNYRIYKSKNLKNEKQIKIYKQQLLMLTNCIKFYGFKLYDDENKILNVISNNNEKNKKEIEKKVDITKRIKTNPINKNILPVISKVNNKDKDFNIINEKEEEESNLNDKKNGKNNDDSSLNKTSFCIENDTSLFKNIYNEKEKDNQINNKERKKINILKIDELLDIDNIEIEGEEIIDDELNSDDEVLFEKKIKPKKKISVEFLPKIRKEVPSINLSQIEFNKLKVIYEADAYSLQKRNFENESINGQIKSIKTQIKNMEKKISVNKRKLDVIHNFIEDVKYNYKLLRPIKVHTSAAGNPVHYIREKLLDAVEESINETEKKEKKEKKAFSNIKNKKEKEALGGGLEKDEEIVGSDYSDEDEYIQSDRNKYSRSDNKENNDNNQQQELNKNNQKRNIKTNLMSKYESHEKENKNNDHQKENISNNKTFGDNIFKNINTQSK